MENQFQKYWAPVASVVGAVLLAFQLAQAFSGNRTLVTGLLIFFSLIAIGAGMGKFAFEPSSIPDYQKYRYRYHRLAKIILGFDLIAVLVSGAFNLTVLNVIPDCCGFVPTKTPAPISTLTPTMTPTITLTPISVSQTPMLTATPTFTPTSMPTPTQMGGGPGHIVFSATDEDGDLEIYFLDIFRQVPKPVKLTNNTVPDFDPVWSPDGNKIAFVSYRDGRPDIFIMKFDGSEPINITNSASEDYSPAWAPDGEKLVFSTHTGNTEIYKINIDAKNLVQLTNINSFDAEPSVSISPKSGLNVVVFQSNRNNPDYSELYVMVLDGSDVKRLTPNRQRQWDTSPSFSPDGTKIVFISSQLGQNDIFVVYSDGTNLQQLTFTNSANQYSPSWSPDGRHIIFSSHSDDMNTIYQMESDGSNVIQIIKMKDANYPSWRP